MWDAFVGNLWITAREKLLSMFITEHVVIFLPAVSGQPVYRETGREQIVKCLPASHGRALAGISHQHKSHFVGERPGHLKKQRDGEHGSLVDYHKSGSQASALLLQGVEQGMDGHSRTSGLR